MPDVKKHSKADLLINQYLLNNYYMSDTPHIFPLRKNKYLKEKSLELSNIMILAEK